MNFVADESVDHPIVLRLRELGHHVVAVAEVAGDKDIGELVFRQRLHSSGVL